MCVGWLVSRIMCVCVCVCVCVWRLRFEITIIDHDLQWRLLNTTCTSGLQTATLLLLLSTTTQTESNHLKQPYIQCLLKAKFWSHGHMQLHSIKILIGNIYTSAVGLFEMNNNYCRNIKLQLDFVCSDNNSFLILPDFTTVKPTRALIDHCVVYLLELTTTTLEREEHWLHTVALTLME